MKSKLNKKIDTIQQEDFNKSDRYVLECEKIDKDGESGEEIDDSEFLQRDQNIKGIYIKKYRLKKKGSLEDRVKIPEYTIIHMHAFFIKKGFRKG